MFFGCYQSEDLLSENLIISISVRVATCDERFLLPSNNSVGFDLSLVLKQNDVSTSQSHTFRRLYVENVAIANGGIHASATRLKAKADSLGRQATCQIFEGERRSPLLRQRLWHVSIDWPPQPPTRRVRSRIRNKGQGLLPDREIQRSIAAPPDYETEGSSGQTIRRPPATCSVARSNSCLRVAE